MNADSEDEDDVLSTSSRSRTISSLRSQLAQAIEDSNYHAKNVETIRSELAQVKTDHAVQLSELNEQVGDMQLEMHQLEMQLDESLAQRTEEMDDRIRQEREEHEETLKEAISETERLRAALAEESQKRSSSTRMQGKLEESEKARAKFEKQSELAEAELSVLRTAKRGLEERIDNLVAARTTEEERYSTLLKTYEAVSQKKEELQNKEFFFLLRNRLVCL